MWTLPNILTLIRIAVIPILVASFYMEQPLGSWIAGVTFMFAGITDFFDGYFARASGTVSKIGQFLDPIADKLMVGSVLIMVVAVQWVDGVHVIPVVIILCRELLVSGLREFLAGSAVSVPVSTLAKWKTMVQMVSLGGCCYIPAWSAFGLPIYEAAISLLWIAALLTLITGYDYLKFGLKHMLK